MANRGSFRPSILARVLRRKKFAPVVPRIRNTAGLFGADAAMLLPRTSIWSQKPGDTCPGPRPVLRRDICPTSGVTIPGFFSGCRRRQWTRPSAFSECDRRRDRIAEPKMRKLGEKVSKKFRPEPDMWVSAFHRNSRRVRAGNLEQICRVENCAMEVEFLRSLQRNRLHLI